MTFHLTFIAKGTLRIGTLRSRSVIDSRRHCFSLKDREVL